MESDKVEAQDSTGILFCTFHTIHLDNRSVVGTDKRKEILVKMSGLGWLWFGMVLRSASGFAFYSLREVNEADIKFTAVDKPPERRFTDGQEVLICLYDMVNRLPLADQRSNDGVDLVQLGGGKVKAIAGIDESVFILLVSIFTVIKAPFKMAEILFKAGVA